MDRSSVASVSSCWSGSLSAFARTVWICFRVFSAWSVERRPCSWTEPPDPDSKACLTAIKADGADQLDGFSKRSEFGRRLIRNVRRM